MSNTDDQSAPGPHVAQPRYLNAHAATAAALSVNVGIGGGLQLSMASRTTVALATACIGMWIGGVIRSLMSEMAFRKAFFAGMLLLGLHLIARSVA